MTQQEKRYLIAEPIVAWGSFLILLTLYWITVAPTVSYWDCPEYVAAAWLLEIGHPPGNPVWMLTERVITMLAPNAGYAALAVNLSSGLFTALAAMLLAKSIFRVAIYVLLKLPRRRIPAPLAAACTALCGALAFGFSDSAWYSAVEAEVYAMSIFMTSLCLWIMTKWAGTRNRAESWRLLVLLAYLFGLSIGIHQLNLLCIPALAMIWAAKHHISRPPQLIAIFSLSLIAVGCVLVGMMPSTIALAAEFELIAVNSLNLPLLSGVVIYVMVLGISLIAAIVATRKLHSRIAMAICCFPAIYLSGIFIFSEHFALGAIISAIVSALLVCGSDFHGKKLSFAIMMLTMLLAGYSSYALIPIRGTVPSPANAAMPGDPFSFASYQSREQYGSKPLIYGPTPYSRPMLIEDFDADGQPIYRRRSLAAGRPMIVHKVEGARLRKHIPLLASEDSASNARLLARPGDAYIFTGLRPRTVGTPELNMWFPRITSSNPTDLRSYAEWVGMDTSTMVKVGISEAFDSLGHPVAKLNADGSRSNPESYRPTYLQNLQWLASYQMGYMYWRYLLWNFSGRQNDYPSTGEVQHGNFITGFPAVDNAMLGAEDALPPEIGRDNPGRNRYFMLPLLLGIIGMIWLLKSRKRGMQVCAINAILFVMSGLAIVVYLNQDPGEPRERDYSFLGSFLAYAIWIGFGALAVARKCRSAWGFSIPLAIVAWMAVENFDDHDRSNRYAARNLTSNILNAAEQDAIIFVSGDNFTFPLWYAQEVEGVRRDIRVINTAYINSPIYASNMMNQWRESSGVKSVLKRPDILAGAFTLTTMTPNAHDTMPATEMLRAIRRNPDAEIGVRYVTIPVSPDSTAVFDLRDFCRPGSRSIDFGSLFTLDIIASNAEALHPRPVYWLRSSAQALHHNFRGIASRWLYGYQFGVRPQNVADSLLVCSALTVIAPNGYHTDVYMDRTPAMQITFQRVALATAAEELLRHGNTKHAAQFLDKADRLMGHHPFSYGNVMVEDTLFRTRLMLGRLMIEVADSLSDPQKTEFRARGLRLIDEYNAAEEARIRYNKALPPRLRSKVAL